jgi:uroporphyrinogen-III synthase
MKPVIVIRPQSGCDATVAAARALGLEAHGFPLFAVAPVAWRAPEPDSFDALLLGSANALRHGGAALADYAGKPAYAVGRTTAEAASGAGFDVIATGQGGLQSVLELIHPEHRRLLRLSGRERVMLSAPAGIALAERTVYASEPQPMPPALAALLANPAIVLLHSAEAARHFAELCDSRTDIALAVIGPRVAEAVGQGWRALGIATDPDDTALLALASRMCQDP